MKSTAASTGPMARTIVVLPDFTAVLPQETPPEQLFRFVQVGILHSLDRIYKGAIDRATLNNSLAQGLDSGTILQRLAEWNAPANVVETPAGMDPGILPSVYSRGDRCSLPAMRR